MKKIITIALALMLALSLAACANNGESDTIMPGNDDADENTDANVPGNEQPQDKTHETNGEIYVNGALIEAPAPSVDGFNGVILVPLQPIAEALGISMDWDGETMSARVGDIYIWIDKDFYTEEGHDPVQFGPAPQLIDNYVYVPIYFFGNALKGYEACITDGSVVISTNIPL